ncbi:13174_t:CDS:2 [Dentiscutata erythropus]|uniref:13174_t:CDS:1 n=1 Tax=Dentiscutata erythropus TaxID=1348616 RepID=A0A9N9E580_9GLOM|nr:13174_t:CDS:2 [Dentiscutata erythropus]
MPFFPLGTRQLTLEEMHIDKRLECKQVAVETRDKCELAGIIVKAINGDDNITDVLFDDREPIIIYFQGNAGNMLFRIPVFAKLILYSTNIVKKLQIVAIGYRGYWFSTGSPSEKGLQIDALSIYEFVRVLYPKNPIYIYGHSLGGAVALYLASNEKIQKELKGIIIENAFTSIKDMVTTIYPQKWLPYKYLVNIPLLIRNKWDNYHVIQGIKIPILFLSSRNDEIVPQEQMIELYKKAKMSKKKVWVEFENALHEDVYSHKGFVEAIKVFINETIADQGD